MKYTYDFQDQVRDLDNYFFTTLEKRPLFLSQIKYDPSNPITNTKKEWLNENIASQETAVTVLNTDGDGTLFDVVSSAGLLVGDVIRFTSSTGATYTEVAKVGVINSTTQITIVRQYAGTTGVTLQVGDKVIMSSRPKQEGSLVIGGNPTRPTSDYNFTQIFSEDVILTGTDIEVNSYGFDSIGAKLNSEITKMAYYAQSKLNDACIYGERLISSTGVPATMGGVLRYIRGGSVENAGGAISQTLINNAFERMFVAGAQNENLVILCNTNQARKLTALVTLNSAIGPIAPNATGGSINSFFGDIAGTNYGGNIVVDPRFPKDQIAILDMSKIELKNLRNRGFSDFDCSDPKEDAIRRRLLAEMTLQIQNAETCHSLITGLTI